MRLPAVLVLSVILLTAFVQLDIGPDPVGEADGAGTLQATIDFDAYEPDVDVDPQRGGIITYTGHVVTTQPYDLDFQFGIISLVADCTGGWAVTEIPVMTVTRTRTLLNFSVSVIVPPFSISTEESEIHKIIISGSWVLEPGFGSGQISPAEAFIHVNQIYQYSIRADPGYVHTSPGGEFNIDLVIENTGNGDDEIEVSIGRRETMENNGWVFVMKETHFDIPRGETVRIPLTISTPKRWDGWRNVISVVNFQVTSTKAIQNNDVSEVVSYSLYIRQRGVSIPGFEVPLMLASILLVAMLSLYRRK